ncbi:hypothetical protein [Rhodococcus aetherivorans]
MDETTRTIGDAADAMTTEELDTAIAALHGPVNARFSSPATVRQRSIR